MKEEKEEQKEDFVFCEIIGCKREAQGYFEYRSKYIPLCDKHKTFYSSPEYKKLLEDLIIENGFND